MIDHGVTPWFNVNVRKNPKNNAMHVTNAGKARCSEVVPGLIRIGEFAKLCGVTKDTLFHYERLGLIRPDKIDVNGYRYYSPNQFFHMEMIKALKESGAPLSDIEQFKISYNSAQYLRIMTRQKEHLISEIKRLESLAAVMENSVHLVEVALSEPLDEPKVVEREESYLITWDIPTEWDRKLDVIAVEAKVISALLKYCSRIGIQPQQPIGSVVKREDLLEHRAVSYQCFFCVDRRYEDDHVVIKPAGKYLTLLHKDLYSGQREAYDIIFNYVREHKLTICGDCYESEMIGYLGEGRPEDFVVMYDVRVE